MSTEHLPPPPQRVKRQGTFQHIQMVIGIAILLATLFTAWTPAGMLPESLAERFSQAVAPSDATQPVNWSTSTPFPLFRIGIVSGHWGNDSGAVCSDGLQEVDVNQEIATQVKESLVANGYDVDLLKEFDPRLEDYKGLVLVSIHADSCIYVNDQATGFKVSAAMSTTYPEQAARLTACLRQRYATATGLSFHAGSVTADMTSYHAFDEIASETTAAIIEVGFLNLDRVLLTEHPERAAEGITNGILCYIRNENVLSPVTPTP